MAILNITYGGMSVDYPFDVDARMSDHDVRRVAVEVVRSGELPGLHIANLSDDAFDHYVVDRMHRRATKERIYLRPKVPFGAPRPAEA